MSDARDRKARIAALRPAYRADLAAGGDRFLAPRRTTCPWCASTRLSRRLCTTDLLQHKPGRFTLDACAGCGHIFQNPQLTPEGLEFYYRDFYDGLGEQRMSGTFGGRDAMYRGRAEAMLSHDPAPKTWLDV
ncbi:methyltransferase type 12, partial [Streptomyces sp. SID2955]|nr:methyltransferase type 12 [Streptomyces sp. SID2955]